MNSREQEKEKEFRKEKKKRAEWVGEMEWKIWERKENLLGKVNYNCSRMC